MLYAMSVDFQDLGIVCHNHNTRLLVFLCQLDVVFVRSIHCLYHTYSYLIMVVVYYYGLVYS